MNNHNIVVIGLFILSTTAFPIKIYSQNKSTSDTLSTKTLEQVIIYGEKEKHFLPIQKGVNIYAGKKTDVIDLRDGEANLSQNVGRMIFSKIPGANLWDMDGAGTQMNVATRGTDAHRSIEMNMRQNGYNTNSDIFGYPENHYAVPMQAVSQVQLVRGSAALQFGSQFGGMMNYVLKEGDTTRAFSFESDQTFGSFNMFNSFNSVSGKVGKVAYYAYYDDRHSDGWRPNSAYSYRAYHANIKYYFSNKGSLSFQFSRSDTHQQIAGGLTDAQFKSDPRQSNRSRNFFDPILNIPAVTLNYDFSKNTKLQITANGIWGERSSVQFINTPDVADTINTNIGSYNPRQVDRDFYNGFTTEARLLHKYSGGTLAGGVRYFNQKTQRRQKGMGTTGSNNTMELIGPYGIDLEFHTVNYATFVENIFQIGELFSITPGFRYEVIQSDLTGVISNASFPVSYKGNRAFPLFGVGLQYEVSQSTQFYGNFSQAYRPYLYSNITPADQVGVVDPDLKDSKGYDIDIGYRGKISDFLNFDINAFYLFYGNKIGKLTETNPDNSTYQLTTNIGNSVAKGFEMYLNLSLTKLFSGNTLNTDVRIFSSLAYTHARYTEALISSGADNKSLNGNRVENVPDWIERGGLEFRHKTISSTLQVSYVSDQYSDANNTKSVPNGIVGYIPSYFVMDWSFDWQFMHNYHVAAGVNNLANVSYFSRRMNMYPGPGILPAVGRSFYLTLGIKL
jgi:Fe(3+) dicitrate transport protein